jgi:ATP-dependent RNA helicase RhlE
MTDFKKFNLSPTILHSLEKKGYKMPTPIQSQAIPHLLAGRDLLGIAQTGTGKTAAFSLPILDILFKNKKTVKAGNVRALILTPTRELASQIADNIDIYGRELHLKYSVIFGGVNENSQIRSMARGVDILVATPGRLLDLMGQGYVKFSDLEIFVLDEADRMLDMGFINDVKKIIAKLPTKRQTLFFSATMPEAIASLARMILKDPVTIEVTPESTTVEKIDQKIHFVDQANKKLLLKSIVIKEEVTSVLVFSRTKHGANKVVDYLLQESIAVAAIHGNKSQAAREKALNNFRQGAIKVLVATDIAARGIDIPGISHVINYDIPNDPESYVHRIGRTARAGKEGVAISFCDPAERKLLGAIEKLIKISVPVDRDHPYQDTAKRAVKSHEVEKSEVRDYKNSRGAGDYSRSNEDRRRGNFKDGNFKNGASKTSGSRGQHPRPKASDNRGRFDNDDSRRPNSGNRDNRRRFDNDDSRRPNPENRGNRERFNSERPASERAALSDLPKKKSGFFGFFKKDKPKGFAAKGSKPSLSKSLFGNRNARPGGKKPVK